VGWESG